MDDAALVEAARSGDGSAWGAIYDRYADRLHDHCHRILRDRDEAADALHDAFIAASGHLDQLRDPARLRPWLYSICRHESLRRARQRGRVELTDQVGEMSGPELDMDRGVRAEELQELVWSAAAGLNERDRALLDMSVRQGLEGQDLADAMGTSLSNSYVMVSRLRDQVERSLGALLIARLGRDDCEELDHLLADWDGRFSPLLRKRVARHVDGCDICRERRAAAVSPLALLAAAPLVPAPGALRARVLDGIRGGAELQQISFTREGFAAPARGSRSPGKGWRLVAVVALLAGAVGTILVVSDADAPTPLASVGPSTTTIQPEITTTEPPTTATVATTTTSTTTTSTTMEEPVVIPPPDTAPPEITSVTQNATLLSTASCSNALPKTVTVMAAVTDASPVTAQVVWTGPPGTGQTSMPREGATYRATFGSFPAGGTITYTVVATDAGGNTAMSSPRTVVVNPC